MTVPPTETELDAAIAAIPLEDLVYLRLRAFLAQQSEADPADLHALVMPHVERALYRLVLERAEGHRGLAARMLGINRNTLARRLRDLGLDSRGE